MRQEFEGLPPEIPDWIPLLRASAIATLIVIVAVNVVAGPVPPFIIFGILILVGLLLLGLSSKGPTILLLVSFGLLVILSGPFIFPALFVPASAADFILNLATFLAGLLGLVAAIKVLQRRPGDTEAPRKLGRATLAVFAGASLFSLVSTLSYNDARAQERDVKVTARDIEWTETTVVAEPGEVSVFVDNVDPTYHTFTIDELDVRLSIPASSSARVTFQAEPGEYKFYCVPHKAEMTGSLYIE
jgi:plastocyanin